MGGRVMVNVVQGMSGGLVGNHPTHDQETGQNSENEYCAGYTSHDIKYLVSSIEYDLPGVKKVWELSRLCCILRRDMDRVEGVSGEGKEAAAGSGQRGIAMGISISESTNVLHVPFSSPNNDGTPEDGFVDLKAHPEWIPVLPSCIGWPETQSLLKAINAPQSPLMSLAAAHDFVTGPGADRPSVLVSFVVLCLADPSDRDKPAMKHMADFLRAGIDEGMHKTSDALGQRLDVEIRLELQPTRFHLHQVDGWSLTVMTSVRTDETQETRKIWGLVLRVLETTLEGYCDARGKGEG